MTAVENERLATVEKGQSDMAVQLTEVRDDVKAMKATLDNLSGGKQALIWMTGFMISVALAVAAFIRLK